MLDDDFMSETGIGQLQEMEQSEVENLLVDDMAIGVAEIIAVPESVDDLDRHLTHKVMFMDVKTMDGQQHQMFFLPREAEAIEHTVAEYKRMLMDEILNEAPEPIREMLEKLNELLRRAKEDE